MRRMHRAAAGVLAAILCQPGLVPAAQASGAALEVVEQGGSVLFRHDLAEGGRWCVRWNHSVAGFPVDDCYIWRSSQMLLERSHQPDFAAGLGHTAGRGVMRSAAGGGYWIEDINEPVPGNCYRLRLGSLRVDHRIVIDGEETSLSHHAAGKSVRVRVSSGGEGRNDTC